MDMIPREWISWDQYRKNTCKRDLESKLTKCLQKKQFRQMLDLAEQFVDRYPLEKYHFIKLYVHFLNELGNRDIAEYFLKIYFKKSQETIQLAQQKFDLPMVVGSNWFLSRLGEFVDQSAAVKRLVQTKKLKNKPILFLNDNEEISNTEFLKYAEDAFDIVTDRKDVEHLAEFPNISALNMNFFYYSEAICDHSSPFLVKLDPELDRLNISRTCFLLASSTVEKSLNFLKRFDINEGDDYVVMHVRSEGYCDFDHHKNRNGNIYDYEAAIDLLLARGFKVVRIGHKKMLPIDERKGFIDLTLLDRPDEVDIYLCAKAKFYIGSGSGPFSLANTFGTPSLLIGMFPTYSLRSNVLAQFSEVRKISSGKKIPFKTIINSAIRGISSPKALKLNDIKYLPPCSEDILDAVCDMLDFIEGGSVKKLNLENREYFLKNNFNGNMCLKNIEEFVDVNYD